MSYATRSDIEDRFGVSNVSTWADLDNDADATKITNRITRALADADAEINDTLRDGPYAVPLSATYPTTIVRLAAELAGIWLYDARSVDDSEGDPQRGFSALREEARDKLMKIKRGEMRLNVTKTTMVPAIVSD